MVVISKCNSCKTTTTYELSFEIPEKRNAGYCKKCKTNNLVYYSNNNNTIKKEVQEKVQTMAKEKKEKVSKISKVSKSSVILVRPGPMSALVRQSNFRAKYEVIEELCKKVSEFGKQQVTDAIIKAKDANRKTLLPSDLD